ncbi:hypothetical protein HNQ92_002611 [Rhabdobacter roseus]|uniref:Uncharacterized protein n=1 Tax=Rhabdobacter roseus TaxID=1655419 RepID=A0A840TWA9_9BACT|nr:hypothetical protein [Rhabdobacter roseus]MBB5284468.1 hypothetical protein [Rhabdobacter roseus]
MITVIKKYIGGPTSNGYSCDTYEVTIKVFGWVIFRREHQRR